MVYILCMIVLVFFAMIGISAFITSVKGPAYRISGAALTLEGLTEDNAEERVRAAANICRRYRELGLVCICEDEGAREICERLRFEYSFIEIKTHQKGAGS